MENKGSNMILKDMVLVGGGHAHVHVAKMLAMKPMSNVRVTVISRDIESPYSGMMPGYLAGYYTKDECHIDLCKLAAYCRFRFIHAEVNHIDLINKLIYCQDGRPPIRYDVMSIDIGIIPKPLPHKIANEANITSVKPIDRFANRWEIILHKIEQNSFAKEFVIAVVGGGAGGVEVSFAINARFKKLLRSKGISEHLIKVILFNKSDGVMQSHSKTVQEITTRLLQERHIEVYNQTEIIENVIESNPQSPSEYLNYLLDQHGNKYRYDESFWCTQAMAAAWLKESGFEVDEDGCILVEPTLECVNVPGVFACGDVCHNVKYPRPKAGVFAVRAGPPLLANLKHTILQEELEEWIPQDLFLGIINTGEDYAIATKGGLGLEGEFLWTLKDKIDRTWMAPYQNFPTMEEMEEMMKKQAKSTSDSTEKTVLSVVEPNILELLSKAKMRCAGCGSKVGSTILTRAFKRLNISTKKHPNVLAGVGDDAALILPPQEAGACLVQTIDYFRSFVDDPYLFGQITAAHCLSDVFAMNGEAMSALALCVLPYGTEQRVEDELVHMLSGVIKFLDQENCVLVGGHTAEGAELALGLSVTGVVKLQDVFYKGPLLPRQCLILTKAIGTGTILAAQMRIQAKGSWVQETYTSMKQSNAQAAKILKQFHCQVCTDVTGFGLLGHLIEMIQFQREEDNNEEDLINKKQPIKVNIHMHKLPLLSGALECVQKGILSSLHPQNIRCNQAIENLSEAKSFPAFPLLFDPQTSGGLLATVEETQVESLIEALHTAGYNASACIGYVEEFVDHPTEDIFPTIKLHP